MLLHLLLLLPVLWGVPTAQDQRYQLKLPESVTVQEGLCVLVPCKFSFPWTAFGTLHVFWFRKGEDRNRNSLVATNKREQKLQESTQGRFFLLGDPQAHNCSLSIRDVNMRDSGTYFFHMEDALRKHSYLDKTLSLHVTALTQRPEILISGPLESGLPRNLTCSVPWACEQGTPPIFSWTSAALTSLGPRTHLSSVLTLTPRPQDHSSSLICQVKFPAAGVTVERIIQLNITYAPQNTAISISQGNSTALKILQDASPLPVLEGQAMRLLCVADSNPPAELSWFWGSSALNGTPISTTAILELPRVGTTGGDFTCLARHPLGSQNVSVSLSMVYPPQLLRPSCSWDDQSLRCGCSSRAQPAPSLLWWLGAGLLEGNSSNASFTVTSSSEGPWANSSLSLSEGLTSGLPISCEASNVYGAQSATVVLLQGKSEPRARWVLGAVGGAGIMALLSLCLCLLFRVKTCRKKAAQPVQSMDNVNPVEGSGSGAHQHQVWTDSPSDHPAPAGASPVSREEQEPHYSLLQFPKPQEEKGTNTEYTEIKTHK
ncbi:sialic acid-binding Ig-like lectin 5 [Diceros bicornis minor]|uniref:sialic acid-binding Ig-like lectin 5 n=1 Tax=Diceros bicornis minor TaxID=77932 RepID=UPI0026EFF068|nr:sialic acid-binding Ig-like lectin 5 [Diceros bicornis minor]